MRVVNADGRRYLLVRDGESWALRDPASGGRDDREEDVDLDRDRDLEVEGGSRLALLVHLDARGPRTVGDLLAETGLCESELHALVAECRAAGLVTERTVDGRRGYALTDAGERVATD